MNKSCTVDGCDRPVKVISRGLCNRHYRRFQRHGDPLGGGTASGATLSFLRGLVGTQETACITWDGGRTTRLNGAVVTAARAMCILAHGAPPVGKNESAHSCGNGHLPCVNPNHLRWASHAENYADRLLHDTHQRGERHGMAKLTPELVRSIRQQCAAGTPRYKVAAAIGISRQAVNDIIWRRRWGWLE